MAYYPQPGTAQTVVYPGTPMVPSAMQYPGTPIAPSTLAPQHLSPNVVYVPSRSSSRHSHRDDDHERRHSRRHSDNHGHGHSSSSRKRSHRRHESDGHRRHESDGHRHHRSRSHRKRDRSPQVVMIQPQGVPSNGYPTGYGAGYPNGYPYYRPTWTERLRQFFGFAPSHPQFRHQSNKQSWGFFGRSSRQRYYDPYSGAEVDRYGRPVVRI